MRVQIARIAALTIALIGPQIALGAQNPASFNHPDGSLQSRIKFPELRGDSVAMIRCAAQVQRSGKFEDNVCFVQNAGDEVYIKAIYDAAKKARMNPAIIDGKSAAVYVQYRVEFKKEGDNQSVRILNNPGVEENVAAYGEDHIAPQRGLTAEKWQKACPSRMRFLVLGKAHIAEDGSQSSISIVNGGGPPITERCREAIIETLSESRFTPAKADGIAVPSTFVEPFGS